MKENYVAPKQTVIYIESESIIATSNPNADPWASGQQPGGLEEE